jgi:hypothetical protein
MMLTTSQKYYTFMMLTDTEFDTVLFIPLEKKSIFNNADKKWYLHDSQKI